MARERQDLSGRGGAWAKCRALNDQLEWQTVGHDMWEDATEEERRAQRKMREMHLQKNHWPADQYPPEYYLAKYTMQQLSHLFSVPSGEFLLGGYFIFL